MIKQQDFEKMVEINVNDLDSYKFKNNEKFLMGESMIDQKFSKKIGDSISYYQISKIDNKNIQYIVKYDRLGE
jgi:hypothetical protein